MPNCEYMFVHRKQGFFLSVYVDDIEMAGRKQSDTPTSFLDRDEIILKSVQRNVRITNFLLEQLSNYQGGRNLTQKLLRGPTIRSKCVERDCELANKKTEQLYKVSSPCLYDHHFKRE